jgi:DedD protein
MTLGVKRNSSRQAAAGPADTQSQEALRVRARRRLIGAVALVLLGVIVFPLVFESRPKPVPSNIQLDIPSQSKAPALAPPASVPAATAASAPMSTERAPVASAAHVVVPPPSAAVPAVRTTPTASVPTRPAVAAAPAPAPEPVSQQPTPAPRPAAPVEKASRRQQGPAPAPQPSTAPAKAQSKAIAGARNALAALEGKSPTQISLAQAEAALAHGHAKTEEAAPSKSRFVVQAGAFADAHTAQAVRAGIEKAGFNSYTQVVDTAQGKRIRVRVGPFANREDAERALTKLRRLGLSGAVLSL